MFACPSARSPGNPSLCGPSRSPPSCPEQRVSTPQNARRQREAMTKGPALRCLLTRVGDGVMVTGVEAQSTERGRGSWRVRCRRLRGRLGLRRLRGCSFRLRWVPLQAGHSVALPRLPSPSRTAGGEMK